MIESQSRNQSQHRPQRQTEKRGRVCCNDDTFTKTIYSGLFMLLSIVVLTLLVVLPIVAYVLDHKRKTRQQ